MGRFVSFICNYCRYKQETDSFAVSDGELVKITASARSLAFVEVPVTKKGVQLKWFFKLSHGDIDFKIVKDGHEVKYVIYYTLGAAA